MLVGVSGANVQVPGGKYPPLQPNLQNPLSPQTSFYHYDALLGALNFFQNFSLKKQLTEKRHIFLYLSVSPKTEVGMKILEEHR